MRPRDLIATILGLSLLILLLGPGSAASQERTLSAQPKTSRFALVIGNDSYTRVRKLENARADAQAMARALQQSGFDVTLRLDLGDRAMREAVRNFKARLSGGSEAVFYFAGHGVQLGAANYLLPVDISTDNEEQVRDDGLALQRVLDDMTEQKVRFSLAIVDACRDNPFPRVAGRSIGTSRGLAPTTAATGQMVIYSAGAGQTALDRLDARDRNPNGLFTRVFLQEMQRPGISVDRMLRDVRDQVVAMAKSVGHEQVPALYDQAIGSFYFRPGGPGQVAVAPSVPPAPVIAVDTSANERAFWDSVKGTKNPDELKAYIEQYPNGSFVSLARARLNSLQPPSQQLALATPSVQGGGSPIDAFIRLRTGGRTSERCNDPSASYSIYNAAGEGMLTGEFRTAKSVISKHQIFRDSISYLGNVNGLHRFGYRVTTENASDGKKLTFDVVSETDLSSRIRTVSSLRRDDQQVLIRDGNFNNGNAVPFHMRCN